MSFQVEKSKQAQKRRSIQLVPLMSSLPNESQQVFIHNVYNYYLEVKAVFKVAALLSNMSRHLIVKQWRLLFIRRASTFGLCTPPTSALPEKQLTESNVLDHGFSLGLWRIDGKVHNTPLQGKATAAVLENNII